jgi:predicted phosphodiesterase
LGTINGFNVKSSFIEAATAANMGDSTNYIPKQIDLQYADKDIDIVAFGHTHYPLVKNFDNGRCHRNGSDGSASLD